MHCNFYVRNNLPVRNPVHSTINTHLYQSHIHYTVGATVVLSLGNTTKRCTKL